jgi:methionyl-tRNA formyltransferase
MRFFLFGSGDIAKAVYQSKKKRNNLDFFWAYNEKWDKAWSNTLKISPREVAKGESNAFNVSSQDNLIILLDKLKPDIGLVIGSRWIFGDAFFSKFSIGVFNYHPSPLPYYKGAGGFTWQMLHNQKKAYATIHKMEKNVDAGGIVLQRTTRLKKDISLLEFSQVVTDLSIKTILEFISKINQGHTFQKSRLQKVGEGTYFPLLKTKINGAINWQWRGDEIESFVKAFSHPYDGAFTFLGSNKIRIKIFDCRFERKIALHPYTFGIIVVKTKKFIKISVRNGLLKILMKDIFTKNKADEIIKLGARLWTPTTVLEKGLYHRPKNK